MLWNYYADSIDSALQENLNNLLDDETDKPIYYSIGRQQLPLSSKINIASDENCLMLDKEAENNRLYKQNLKVFERNLL